MKKILISLIIFLISLEAYTFPKIENILNMALENNTEIKTAENNLRSAEISAKTLDAYYAPSVTFANQNTIQDGKSITDVPLNSETYINITQPVPGGTSLAITGDYSFSTAELGKDIYISQVPQVSFSLTQSLYPFWLQGTVKDPVQLNGSLQREYYFYAKEYTKKQVLQEIIQNYAYALIYKNQMMSYANTIEYVKKQIDALRQLQINGGTNTAKITELENNKWSYEQDLISCRISYESYLQAIKNLCGINVEFEQEADDRFELTDAGELLELFLFSKDPLDEQYQLKIKILQNENKLQKQNSAPTVNISVTPQWALETQKKEDWKDAWNSKGTNNWITSVSFDFSSLLSSVIKKASEQNKIEMETLLLSYDSYKKQKEFVKEQYRNLISSFEKQKEDVDVLYDKAILEENDLKIQFQKGAISSLDYESNVCQMKNCELSKKCVEIYLWLYEFLLNFA